MKIIIKTQGTLAIYEQIVDQVKHQIIMGQIKENDALPSVRGLSSELKISALTVKKAYDRLETEGFVVTVHGKGTFVAATDRELAVEARRKAVEDDFTNAIQKAKTVGMTAEEVIDSDPEERNPQNEILWNHLRELRKSNINWGAIS